jgi:membrane protein implicated in regulation of membrane protease activity
MKLASIFGVGLTALWAMLALLQLWFEIFTNTIFFKITVSCGILLALVVLGALVYREYIRENDLKDKGYLD